MRKAQPFRCAAAASEVSPRCKIINHLVYRLPVSTHTHAFTASFVSPRSYPSNTHTPIVNTLTCCYRPHISAIRKHSMKSFSDINLSFLLASNTHLGEKKLNQLCACVCEKRERVRQKKRERECVFSVGITWKPLPPSSISKTHRRARMHAGTHAHTQCQCSPPAQGSPVCIANEAC